MANDNQTQDEEEKQIQRRAQRTALKRRRKEERTSQKNLLEEYYHRMGEIFADARWRELFGDNKFLLVDGGAQGGLEKEWRSVAPLLRVAAVEPRTKHGLADANFEVIILNIALDRVPGTRALYLAGSMSSFLRPDFDMCEQFGFSLRKPLESVLVETTTLDAIVREHRLRFVDFVKLDTQGTELDILRGGPETIGKMAVGLRVEVSFSPLYESQPLFADVDFHVRSQHFDFVDFIHRLHRRRRRPGVADTIAMEASSEQLIQADAIYFRTPARLVGYLQTLAAPDRIRYLAGALVACMTYSQFDLAAHYIHETGSLIEPHSRALMLELLRYAIRSEPVPS